MTDTAATDPAIAEKVSRGRRAYLSGQAAEETVMRVYQRAGYALANQRWRGGGGEIDLIFRKGNALVFVEVKQSASFARAAEMLKPDQVQRIMDAATAFVAGEPMGQLTEMQFDVALVDGHGQTEILENALMMA
jgi:putative endonuclease